jgi:hypothetical protein
MRHVPIGFGRRIGWFATRADNDVNGSEALVRIVVPLCADCPGGKHASGMFASRGPGTILRKVSQFETMPAEIPSNSCHYCVGPLLRS